MTHLKTLNIPNVWGVERKGKKFVLKTSPGPHNHRSSIPLGILLRDILKVTNSSKKAKFLLNNGDVLVDGTIRKDIKFPVGIMDVISFPKIKKHYRITFNNKGKLVPLEIPASESNQKIVMIIGKTALKGGRMQINFSDGKNLIVSKTEAKKYSTQASVVIEIPKIKIVKYLPFEKGMTAFVIAGKHVGELAKISELKPFKGPQADRVLMEGKDGEYDTLENYAFVVGKTKSEVKIA